MKLEYQVVCENSPQDLERTLSEQIALGWVPLGGLTVLPRNEHHHLCFFQAMTRHARRVENKASVHA